MSAIADMIAPSRAPANRFRAALNLSPTSIVGGYENKVPGHFHAECANSGRRDAAVEMTGSWYSSENG
jgi:hypothetical protein